MPSKTLSVIQPVPIISCPENFESFRTSILEEFAEKVPDELRLPRSVIDNPPKDDTAIPRECGLLSPEEIQITEKYDATALAAAIASKQFTAVAVATAFAKRAIIAHQLTCCLIEWFMDEAIEQAKAWMITLKLQEIPLAPSMAFPSV
ncbi:Fc.00g104500.m01.CDS01 [Cosmosporella sp. VM-42]